MLIEFTNFYDLNRAISECDKAHPITATLRNRILIMNRNTEHKLLEMSGFSEDQPIRYENYYNTGKIATYRGYHVLIDNSLLDNYINIR